ncbi:hypothetical protein BG000_007025, partial [Podila horticola]
MSSKNSQDLPVRGRGRGRGRGRARPGTKSMDNVLQADPDPTLRTLSTRANSYFSYLPMPTECSEGSIQTEHVDHDLDPNQHVSAENSVISTLPILHLHNKCALMSGAATVDSDESSTVLTAEPTLSLDPSASSPTSQSTSPAFPPQDNLENLTAQGSITDQTTSPQSNPDGPILRNTDDLITQGNTNDRSTASQISFDNPTTQGNINVQITQGNNHDQAILPYTSRHDLTSSPQRNHAGATSFPQRNLADPTSSQGDFIDMISPHSDLNDTHSSQDICNDSTYPREITLFDPSSYPLQSNTYDPTAVRHNNLDNPTSFQENPPQINPSDASSSPSQRTLSELCNPNTVDFAFEFVVPSTNNHVGLWAHQSVLMSSPGAFTSLFGLPNKPDTSSTCLRRFYESRVFIPEFSLVAHCALLHFLYAAEEEAEEVPDQIDLRNFVLTPIPVIPCMVDDVVDMILWPVHVTPWRELLLLARRYHLDDTLGVQCQDKIVANLTFLDAVPTLLVLGGSYPGMKTRILDWCARTVLRVYNALRDPAVREVDRPMLQAVIAGMFERVEGWQGVAEACAEILQAIQCLTRPR